MVQVLMFDYMRERGRRRAKNSSYTWALKKMPRNKIKSAQVALRLLTSIELDEVSNLPSLQIDLNGVIHLDEGVRIADGASIMSHQMRDSFCPHKDLSDFAQLILEA